MKTPRNKTDAEKQCQKAEELLNTERSRSVPSTPLRDQSTPLRDQSTPLRDQSTPLRDQSEASYLKLIHELEVHQVELELQNEELRRARKVAELATNKYTNLYEFAPSGYVTLSALSEIIEINTTGTQMLGKDRSMLINQKFTNFASPDTRPVFNLFLEKVFQSKLKETCEVALLINGDRPTYVLLTGIISENQEQCHVTVMDITGRKISETRLQKDVVRNALLMELFALAPVLTDKELYDRALDIAVKLSDSKIGFFHQVSDNQQEIMLTTWNDEARKSCTTIHDNHYPIIKAGNWADCVKQKQAVVYNDFQQSPNKKGLPEGHAPVGRFMSIPVVQDDKVLLIFGVGNKTSDYTDSDVVQIQSVADELHKILEKRKVEQSLHKIEDRWQFAIEGSNDGIWDWNVLTDEVFFSNRWKEMIGYGPAELEGKLGDWKERVHPDDLPAVMETLQRHFNGETPQYITEHRIRCKDGSWKWITDRGKVLEWTPEGKPARMVGTHSDITERRQAEMKLILSEEKYRQLYEFNQMPISIFDIDTLNFLSVNNAWVDKYGYTKEELLSMTILEIRPDSEIEKVKQSVKIIGKGLENVGEYLHKKKNGEIIQVEIIRYDLVFEGKNAKLVFANDISERKQAEDKVIEQLNELQRWYQVTLGRESRVIELKEEVNELLKQRGEAVRYESELYK